ncbi:hypothetical protein TB1_000435 [Malus domestica]
MEENYLSPEPMMTLVSVEEAGKKRLTMAGLSKRKEPEMVYSNQMVFNKPSLALVNHLKPIYVVAHLKGVPFKRVLLDGGAAVNVLPLKQMKRLCRRSYSTYLTVSSFSKAITKTYGILPLEVDLRSKQIMLAFFVMDNNSTYRALLGRDWIHQSLYVSFTLHQQVAVYHESRDEEPGFWEIVEGESRPFLPTANVAEANFYNPNIRIL